LNIVESLSANTGVNGTPRRSGADEKGGAP